ncbi:protein HEADING DATE REPRESSOR 1 isoform X2 [Amborella trichopoda]|uniref:Protein HEADING DATE REPRESSOR 1-like n=1 Tax=Amborella trichopoda TaxID=13333 RepID=W1PGG3_AMBTC|nr:protein HEADING DATE REPRESSOR 1 isoform X2 [Amborella trichopoda]ERN07073.1 hypothetical protein AMTR_s00019p00063140 [Amborella trichopoda]|eukprot:XP_006845398.1 protein HEADING DATE REPRESSOR 1 isoform X2 [Amborella trichopoda]
MGQTEVPSSDQERTQTPISQTRDFWNSRKRNDVGNINKGMMDESLKTPDKKETPPINENHVEAMSIELSGRRKALFEPLGPTKRPAESLLPPPDFDSASYPRGWLVGKKRKLVNVDVVESMRRIAVQEMNRKDREIDGLNEQLEEDARCLEHLQVQLQEERNKHAAVERENGLLQSQITMLMSMLQGNEDTEEEHTYEP